MNVIITYRCQLGRETVTARTVVKLNEGQGVRTVERQLIAICRKCGGLLLGFAPGIGHIVYE